MKYIFTVQMARTLCRKGGVEKDCAVHQDPAVVRTTRLAWSQICLSLQLSASYTYSLMVNL